MRLALPSVFRHRNYRLFFFGQMVSLMGTWMQQVALGWLVYRLTNSPFLLGLVGFASQAPLLFVTPFAGALADRRNRRDLFVLTQGLCMVQAAILAVLTLTGSETIPLVIVLSLFWGVVTAIETPTRQAFTIEMVGREDLRQAIALNAMMFNLARTVGPALGGILVAVIGEGWCFALNTLSYFGVLACLLAMRLAPMAKKPDTHPLHDLMQGARYVTTHKKIRAALLLSTATGFFGMSFLALLPAYVRDVLHLQSDALGFVMGAFGLGAVAGAASASRLPERRIAVTPILAAGSLGALLVVFAHMTALIPAILIMLPAGFSYLSLVVTNNSQIQMMADDSIRGRVMSFYSMGALGSQALGVLLLGSIADRAGVPLALTIGGAACVVTAGIAYAHLAREPAA